MPQFLTGIASVKKGWLQNRVFCESGLNAAGINFTSRLPLQIMVAPDMVRIGMSIQYGCQMPAVLIQNMPDLPPCILVIPAVNQIDIILIPNIDSYLCRTVYVIAPFTDLH